MSFRNHSFILIFLCLAFSSCKHEIVIKEVEKTVYVETEKPVYVEIGTGETYKWKIDLSQLLIKKTTVKNFIWKSGKKTEQYDKYFCTVDLTNGFERLPKKDDCVKIVWKGNSDKTISDLQIRFIDNNTETAKWRQILSDTIINDVSANEDFTLEHTFTFTKDPIEKVVLEFSYKPDILDQEATFTLSGLLPAMNKSFALAPAGVPVVNPHKGFVQYAWSSDSINNIYGETSLASGKNKAWDYCSVVYTGAGWSSIHKGKNEYDWSAIDKLLNLCAENGRTLGWRIYPINTSAKLEKKEPGSGEHVPQYIYNEGCPYVDAIIKDTNITIRVPDWENPIYIQACKDFAAEMARRYDGDKRVEFIDVRSFGNWGEWHCSQLEGSEMPSEEIQKDMIAYYASVFKTTQLVMPSDCRGDVYEYALSLGIAKRDDGLIQIKGREDKLAKCYEAGLPTIGENCDVYERLLALDDRNDYRQKWTLERWKQVINVAHLSYYELDRDKCAKDFFKANEEYIKEMNNKLGYNFEVKSAKLNIDENNNTMLTVTIKNTGLAPAFFDVNLIADVCNALGNRKFQLGSLKRIKKGSFLDGDEKTFVFYANFQPLCKGDFLCLGLYEDAASSEPNVKFDNANTLKNNKLKLGEL